MISFENKVVLVTGANGQLGRELCKQFQENGATVIGLDIQAEPKTEMFLYCKGDLVNKHEIEQCLSYFLTRVPSIDILVNNAGVSTFESFEERSEDAFDWVMDVNLKGTFSCIQTYVKVVDELKQHSGAIVNIASLYGIVSPDFRIYTDCDRKNSEVYGATKAGVIQMTKYFSVHLASRKIRVNAVSPGGIFNPEMPQGPDFIKNYSQRCPMERMGAAKEVTDGVLFLSSDLASYITGHNLVIDGGFSAW